MLDETRTEGFAVVIGAGTMGSGIAADLANAGWRVRLLDVPEGGTGRSAAAEAGLARIQTARPPLLFLKEFAERIETGSATDDLACLRDADWVVEAVAERMEVKRAVLAAIDANAGPHTVVTSNTSGLGLREMATGCSASFRSRFLGSHFLNPPRYLKLLEVVPLPETDPEIASGFVRFAEQVLGHRVVIASDTPGFISTRIWIEHLLATMHLTLKQGLTVEEVDALTGPFLGRPRSATFRMADIVGLDIVAAIAGNQRAALPDDPYRDTLLLPDTVSRLIAEGRLGDKAGGGFYRREGGAILSLDLETGAYRPRIEPDFPEVQSLLRRPLKERLAQLESHRETRWGRFVTALLDSLSEYVEYAGPAIDSDPLSVDNVMRWGFQWEMGPFEMAETRWSGAADAAEQRARWQSLFVNIGREMPSFPGYLSIAECRANGGVLMETDHGALIDLGEGVGCIQFLTKMNTIGPGLCDTIDAALSRAESEMRALVIGGDGPHFSAGYDLKRLLEAAQAADWTGIDALLRQVQAVYLRLKYSPIPIVAAVRGYTLGAGCECALHCSAIQAATELTMGLPEIAAGLAPGAGGIKELLFRAMEGWDGSSDPMPRVLTAFRQVAVDANADSGYAALKMGLLRETDSISRNPDRLLFDARQHALALAEMPYEVPERRKVRLFGEAAQARMEAEIAGLRASGAYTETDATIGARVAGVLSGGESRQRDADEEEILALEREALISLAAEPASQARMSALLETGKPLRN